MTLPELPKSPPRPLVWASRVRHNEPHGLDLLEAHVLAYASRADELSKMSWWSIAWNVVSQLLAVFASIGGFAAVFGNPRTEWRGWTDAPDMDAIPWASLSYGVAIVGIVLIVIRWIRDGRRRDTGLRVALAWTFAFGVLGVAVAFALAAEADMDLGSKMLTAYMMMGLAVIVFVLIQLSPPPDPEPERPTVSVEELDERGIKYLMQARDEALDKYWERRLDPDLNLDMLKELKARPLGRLHLNDEA